MTNACGSAAIAQTSCGLKASRARRPAGPSGRAPDAAAGTAGRPAGCRSRPRGAARRSTCPAGRPSVLATQARRHQATASPGRRASARCSAPSACSSASSWAWRSAPANPSRPRWAAAICCHSAPEIGARRSPRARPRSPPRPPGARPAAAGAAARACARPAASSPAPRCAAPRAPAGPRGHRRHRERERLLPPRGATSPARVGGGAGAGLRPHQPRRARRRPAATPAASG